jgi:hypothetical protein
MTDYRSSSTSRSPIVLFGVNPTSGMPGPAAPA